MSWQGVQGHDDVVAAFRRAIERGRLASTHLFVGPEGIGKRTFAVSLAQALLCRRSAEDRLDPCGQCPSCLQAQSSNHPDLLMVARPKDRAFIPIELLIGSKESRMQAGLCHDISLKPMMGGRRVAIIDDADFLKQPEGSNCLLKTLEEPPPKSVLILIGTSAERQLPTIRSRAQLTRFSPLDVETVSNLLIEQGVTSDQEEARRWAERSGGSIAMARTLSDPDLWKFRGELFDALSGPRLESLELAKSLGTFIDDAGKDAPPRRARARAILGFAVEFHRELTRTLLGASRTQDEELSLAVGRAAGQWPGNEETALECAERCLLAMEHVDRNVNQANWLEGWLDELVTIRGA